MAENTIEVSIKRPDGTWGGLSDASEMEPSNVGFNTLQNLYHSRDGTELRRWLGSAKVADPFLGEPIGIISITKGSPNDTIELERPHLFLSSATRRVYFKDNAVIADGVYTATYASHTSFTIPTAASASQSGSSAGGATGRVFVQRSTSPQILAQADGKPVIVGECDPGLEGETTPTRRDIASWVSSRRMDPDDVELPGYVDETASPELAVDEGIHYWPSPTLRLEYEDEQIIINTQSTGSSTYGEAWRYVFDMELTRRLVADVMNGRILIAAPGHGCMFEVDVRRVKTPFKLASKVAEGLRIPEHRRTKALGIHKGAIKSVTFLGSGANVGWTDGLKISFAVGFFNMFTGEVGLPSRIIKSPQLGITGSAATALVVEFFYPRVHLREASGLGVIIYASEQHDPNAEVALLFPIRVISVNATNTDRSLGDPAETMLAATTTIDWIPDIEHPRWPRRWPVIEQLPTGAGWVRVVRSRMFAGGDGPESVAIEFQRELFNSNLQNSISVVSPINNAPTIPLGLDLNGLADARLLPSSYLGHVVMYDNVDANLSALRTLQWMEPLTSAPYNYTTRFEVDQFVFDAAGSGTAHEGYLLKRPDLVAFSEEGFPGVVPGANRLPVDQFEGGTPTGMARVGDDALVFTDRETRLFQWGAIPRLATSLVISNQRGLIAPASAVEGPGFAAWISADGPMAYFAGGGLQWIGADILELWRTFLTQSDGLMCEIQGVHDRDRNLIIWQLTTEYDDDTDDASRSKTTCNRLLVWHYLLNRFSLVTRADNARPHCLGTLPMNDSSATGKKFRWVPACVMPAGEGDGTFPIHVFDENYLDRVSAPLTLTATAANSSATPAIFHCADTTGVGEGDEAFLRDRAGKLKWFGYLTPISATTVRLNDPDNTEWNIGDVMEVKVIHGSLVTNYLQLGEVGVEQVVRGGSVRALLAESNVSAHDVYAWARFRVEKEDGTIVNLSRNAWGDPLANGTTLFKQGSIRSKHFRVRIDLIGNCQIRLKDASVHVEENK